MQHHKNFSIICVWYLTTFLFAVLRYGATRTEVFDASLGLSAWNEKRRVEAVGAMREGDVWCLQDDAIQLPLDLRTVRHLYLSRLLSGKTNKYSENTIVEIGVVNNQTWNTFDINRKINWFRFLKISKWSMESFFEAFAFLDTVYDI